MTTPTGTISLSDVNIELGRSATAQINMNDADVRTLAGVPSGAISMNDLRGKSFINNIIYAWGNNQHGRLGTNNLTSYSSPVTVVGGITDWTQVSAGNDFSLALRGNGTLWSWGTNYWGSLGTNNLTSYSSPVSVVGGFTDWTQVSAGRHSAGVRSNGSLWTWGNGTNGALGNNGTTNQSSPVTVAGGFTDWTQVSCASAPWTVARRSNGTLWAWGFNSNGQLGDNTQISKSSPVSVVGGFTDWTQASAGYDHCLGVRSNGTVWAWGSNSLGAVGDNTFTARRTSPFAVVGGFTDWTSVSAGQRFSVARRSGGSLWGWGAGGLTGDGTSSSRRSPVAVAGGFTDWNNFPAGEGGTGNSTGLTRSNGTIWTWGFGSNGMLGDGAALFRNSPVSVIGGFTDWTSVSSGAFHKLAIRAA
jgi:alpha-tubulin suppressor-like RCC1 family protein